MKKLVPALFLLVMAISPVKAQLFKKIRIDGMYAQWGYNRDWFSKSSLHFKNGDKYNFTIHDAVAHDKPDFKGFLKTPFDITIPQNSIRLGFYLNKSHTRAIEINFDHTKYVVDDQRARITGKIHGEQIDMDTMIAEPFLHLEHTNGANFLMINYVAQNHLLQRKNIRLNTIYKLGGGVVVPRSDVTIMGKELDNKYHLAGYVLAAEGGIRFYPLKKWFLELTAKGGYANFLNALTVENGTVKHHFYFAEVIGLVGYDIGFRKKPAIKQPVTTF